MIVSIDDCSETSSCQFVDITLGIDETDRGTGLLIYPNPSPGLVLIDSKSIGKEILIQVFNSSGQEVLSKRATRTVESIFLENKGMYYLRIQTNGKTHKRKVLIQ